MDDVHPDPMVPLIRKLWEALAEDRQEVLWDKLSNEETAELVQALPPLADDLVASLTEKADQLVGITEDRLGMALQAITPVELGFEEEIGRSWVQSTVTSPPQFPWKSLEVVPIKDIALHETCDTRRFRALADEIEMDGVLRQPVILTRVKDRLLQLDGATRISGLQARGYPHIAAQIVNYTSDVIVTAWMHRAHINRETFFEAARKWRYCEVYNLSVPSAFDVLEAKRACAVIIFDDREAFALVARNSLDDRVACLRGITELYKEEVEVKRKPFSVETLLAHINHSQSHNGRHNVSIAFARVTSQQIVKVALESSARLPSGVTRHLLMCGRQDDIEVPLALLKNPSMSVRQKTETLRTGLLAERVPRVYEPVIKYERVFPRNYKEGT